jgi:hypothetical protein
VKNRLVVALIVWAAVFSPATSSQTLTQTVATNLLMSARWDDGSRIQGTVTLTKVTPTGEAALVTQSLSRGRVSVSEPLDANSLYYVTLTSVNGVQLLKFPVTTALINPANLKSAEVDVVCRKANNSVKSAQFSVSMGF